MLYAEGMDDTELLADYVKRIEHGAQIIGLHGLSPDDTYDLTLAMLWTLIQVHVERGESKAARDVARAAHQVHAIARA